MLRVGQALQGRVGGASRVGCNLSIQQSVFVCVCLCVCVGGDMYYTHSMMMVEMQNCD